MFENIKTELADHIVDWLAEKGIKLADHQHLTVVFKTTPAVFLKVETSWHGNNESALQEVLLNMDSRAASRVRSQLLRGGQTLSEAMQLPLRELRKRPRVGLVTLKKLFHALRKSGIEYPWMKELRQS